MYEKGRAVVNMRKEDKRLKNNKKRLKVISVWELMFIFARPKSNSGHKTDNTIFRPLYGGGRRNPHTATIWAEDT